MNELMYKKLSQAELKMARFLNKMESLAIGLCSYLSYKSEVDNDYHVVTIKIDGESYYRTLYKDLCDKLCISIDGLAVKFDFPKVVNIEISDHCFPFATMYVYYENDECDQYEYNIGLPSSNVTLECMIEDIEDLWRI